MIDSNAPHSATPKMPNLDPTPYESVSLEFKASVRCSSPFPPFDWVFYPRPEYTQNREDYI